MISSHVKITMILVSSGLSLIVLKFVELSSKHLRVFLESLRQSSEILGHLRKFSEILGKCSGTFVWSSVQFWKIFGNLRKVVGNLRKIMKNAVISTFLYTLFDGLAYNTCGYFASCVVFFRAPQGRGKIRAMSEMSTRIYIC